MSRLNTSFVLGYHGCDEEVAKRAIAGEYDLIQSDKRFDWLGPGAYFWESDPRRAAEWAQGKATRKSYARGAVIGAVIDLRNTLDLTTREDLEVLKAAHASFVMHQSLGGLPMPENASAPGGDDVDRSLRYLDCAVIKHLHSLVDEDDSVEPYDTVRGIFTEGGPLYTGSDFQQRTHVQIAVRDPACVLGLFRPRGDAAATVHAILGK